MNRIPQSNGGGNKKTSPKATDNSRYAGSFVKRNRRRIIVGREDKSALNTELTDCVDEVLKRIQHQIGGAIVYLDCEDEEKLITFYSDVAGYKQISERISERDQTKYLQFYKFIK